MEAPIFAVLLLLAVAAPCAAAPGDPTVKIDFPSPDDILSGIVNISGASTGAGYVNVSVDGGGWNRATGVDGWHYLWNASAYGNGTHSILSQAVNGSLSSGTASVQVTVNNSRPALLELTCDLSSRQVYTCDTFTASGFARYDNGVRPAGATVQVTIPGESLNATTDRHGYYSAELAAPGSAGQLTVRAVISSSGLTGTASASIDVLLRDPPDLSVAAGDIYFSPAQPFSDQLITVGAIVHNLGGTDGTARVDFTTSGAQPASVDILVPARGSQNPSVNWTLPSGPHNISVALENIRPSDGDSSNDRAWSVLRVLSRPDLVMSSFVTSNSRPTPGLNITLQASVANTGDQGATGVVRFFDGAPASGTPIGSVPVSLDANSSVNIFQDWQAAGLGDHVLYAVITNVTPQESSDLNDQLTRNVTVARRVAAPGPQGVLPGFEAPALAIALAAIALRTALRRPKS